MSVRPRLLFDLLKTVWICDDGETNLFFFFFFLGEFCSHSQKSSDIWPKGTTPFTSQSMSNMVNNNNKNKIKKKKVVCVHWLVSSTQAVTAVSRSVFLFPHSGTFFTVLSRMRVLQLTVLLAKIAYMTWHRLNSHSAQGVGCSVTT